MYSLQHYKSVHRKNAAFFLLFFLLIFLPKLAFAEVQTFWAEETSEAEATFFQSTPGAAEVQELFSVPEHLAPKLIRVDSANGKIYWTLRHVGFIFRANLDGTERETLREANLNALIHDLELDVANGKMYWVEVINRRIQRANFDGTEEETFVFLGNQIAQPESIEIDSVEEKIYWSFSEPAGGGGFTTGIRRVNFRGTEEERVVEDVLILNQSNLMLRDITRDYSTGKMYWFAQSFYTVTPSRYKFDLFRADLNADNSEKIFQALSITVENGSLIGPEETGRVAVDSVNQQILFRAGLCTGNCTSEASGVEGAIVSVNLNGSDAAVLERGYDSNKKIGLTFVVPQQLEPQVTRTYYPNGTLKTLEEIVFNGLLRDKRTKYYYNPDNSLARLVIDSYFPDLDLNENITRRTDNYYEGGEKVRRYITFYDESGERTQRIYDNYINGKRTRRDYNFYEGGELVKRYINFYDESGERTQVIYDRYINGKRIRRDYTFYEGGVLAKRYINFYDESGERTQVIYDNYVNGKRTRRDYTFYEGGELAKRYINFYDESGERTQLIYDNYVNGKRTRRDYNFYEGGELVKRYINSYDESGERTQLIADEFTNGKLTRRDYIFYEGGEKVKQLINFYDEAGELIDQIVDLCPNNPQKLVPGACGCEVAELSLAPPAFSTEGGEVVFVDLRKADTELTFDIETASIHGSSVVHFESGLAGFPVIDLLQEPTAVRLNGIVLPPAEYKQIADPDGSTSFRVVKHSVEQNSCNTLEVDYQVSIEREGVVSFTHDSVEMISDMVDVSDPVGYLSGYPLEAKYWEQYGPTGLEYDHYQQNVTLKITGPDSGALAEHVVFTNGVITESGLNGTQWRIEFPDYFVSSSFFLHIGDKSQFEIVEGHYQQVPITLYAKEDRADDLPIMLTIAMNLFQELEADYGTYTHNSFVGYITLDGTPSGGGGVEYAGAAISTPQAFRHEVFHSWFARGVMPANGDAGWIDEALAQWFERNYFRREGELSYSTELDSRMPYRRGVNSTVFPSGLDTISRLDAVMANEGADLRSILRDFYGSFARKSVNTEIFQTFLEEKSGLDLDSFFDQLVYGIEN